MEIQRAVHGEECIVGQKFPQEARRLAVESAISEEGATDGMTACRRYTLLRMMEMEEMQKPRLERDFRDMNPDGFWEMDFTVRGIVYQHQFKDLIKDVRSGELRIVKVVSQGLLASDPSLIGKVIYTIRNPRSVAKSQERLVRGFNWTDENGEIHNSFEDTVIHTPEMFIGVTLQACKFLLAHPEIPIRFYHFEDLISKPLEILADMEEFVGAGDYSKASDVVKPALNRSVPEDIESQLWPDAEFVYDKFVYAARIMNRYDGDCPSEILKYRRLAEPFLREIVTYLSDPRRSYNREKRHWYCHRAHMQVNEVMCQQCISQPVVARNFRDHGNSVVGEHNFLKRWEDSPCLFECGMDIDREDDYLSIEESINRNWWKELG
jgi:hypothetical protein